MRNDKKGQTSKRNCREVIWDKTKKIILVSSFCLSLWSLCIARNTEEMTRRNNRENLKFEELDNVVKTVQNLYVKYVDKEVHPISEEDDSTINDIKNGLDSYLDIENNNNSTEYAEVKNKASDLKEKTENYL